MTARVVCVGLATLDSVFRVPSHPGPDGRVVASDHAVAGGGPAATAAVALARLGVPVAFVGAVGDDEAGREIVAGLAAEGVDVSLVDVAAGACSPRSTILVAPGGRAIVHYPGAVPSPRLPAKARSAEWVHVDHVGWAAVARLRTEVRLSVDGGNPIEGLRLDGVRLYAPTEEALRTQVGDARAALDAGAEVVVVTRGEAGCSALTRDGLELDVPGVEVDAVSTLGAGDVFHGALLARLVDGAPLDEALRFANAAAALSCRALDGRSAIPSFEEVAV